VALSQSGQTEEIVETLAWARDCGARTLAITNGAGSALAGVADLALVTLAGPEHAVPATKTFTTQLAALAVLAIGLGADLDPGQLRAVPDEIEAMLATGLDDELDPIVTELAGGDRLGAERRSGAGAGGSGGSPPGEQSGGSPPGRQGGGSPPLAGGAGGTGVAGAVVSGRGMAYAAALELALKLKEACYLHAMGLSWADLLHGPIAVVDPETPAILLAADSGPALPGTIELARRVVAAGARAYAIGGGPGLAAASSRAVPGLPLPEWLAPFGLIVPGQLLTEALSRRLGIDPDSPRGLSKITQTS
jgi:glutamine---fructose-6-phosphate transaminase (isomerizing)